MIQSNVNSKMFVLITHTHSHPLWNFYYATKKTHMARGINQRDSKMQSVCLYFAGLTFSKLLSHTRSISRRVINCADESEWTTVVIRVNARWHRYVVNLIRGIIEQLPVLINVFQLHCCEWQHAAIANWFSAWPRKSQSDEAR